MRLLLDTHAFVWWDRTPERLSRRARAALEEGRHEVFVSVATAWELQIKVQAGRLRLEETLAAPFARQLERNGVVLLLVQLAHVLGLAALPRLHGDPFDRILVAQAREEDMALVTGDRRVQAYAVRTLW